MPSLGTSDEKGHVRLLLLKGFAKARNGSVVMIHPANIWPSGVISVKDSSSA